MEAELLPEIRKIYEYHDWANHQILDAARRLNISEQEAELGGSFKNFIGTLKHILLVEFLFISRWQELPLRQVLEWRTIDQIRDTWLSLETERNKFLSDLEYRTASKIRVGGDTSLPHLHAGCYSPLIFFRSLTIVRAASTPL